MEGVETEEQNKLIREAECDMIQGYYHYRPLELEKLYEVLASVCRAESFGRAEGCR